MKFQRFLAFTLILTTSALLLAGCVRKEQVAVKKAPKAIELTYYKLFDDEDVITPLIQQYRTKHPTVTIKYRKFVDPVEYERLIINQLAEGEGPDIFSMSNYWLLPNTKKLSPLQPAMMTPKQFEQTFVNVAYNDLVLTDNSDSVRKVYGLPLMVDTLALYYNKAFFEDKLPARGRPSPTWETLKDDVFKLTKADNSFERFEVSGIAMGRSDNILRAVDVLYMLLLQFKTRFYNENLSEAVFAQQQVTTTAGPFLNPATEALRLYTSFALPSNKNYSWNNYLASVTSKTKELETFARGKTAMIFGYSYLYEQLKTVLKDLKDKGLQTIDIKNVRISAVPQVKDPAAGGETRVSYANYYAETVSRTSKYPKEAWDFLLFLTSKENIQFYSEKTHRPGSRRDMIEDQKKDPIYGTFAEQTGFAKSFPVYDGGRYDEVFSRAIDSVLATTPVETAVKTAEDLINAILPPQGFLPVKIKQQTQQGVPRGGTKKASTQQ